jgi:alpha-aminoadipic semialdehyde synthase
MKSILIRAEDKNRWESRAPLVPADLKELIDQTGVTAFVEKSEKRFFKTDRYSAAGAQLCDDMNPGDIIFGIKEIPEEKLLDDKVYVFFSHTIKGQTSNMPMLKRIMNGGSTLIDYERVIDAQDRRLIYFGRYAGDAGAIDILWLMGKHWAWAGIDTPFTDVKQALHYDSVADAHEQLKSIGERIKAEGLPASISPLVIGILGYGNVSIGAQQIFDCLPVKRIEPDSLNDLNSKENHAIYMTVFKEEHLVNHKQNLAFDLQDYYDHPGNYESQFDKYLPHLSILVNAVYWESRYPQFVTWESLKSLFSGDTKPKLAGIADITCDVNGSIECNVKSTTSGMPSYVCDPMTRTITDGYEAEGVLLLAVDNLPCELPNDASTFFSAQLKGFVPNILEANFNASLEESGLAPELRKAVIVYRGELTPDYRYLEQFLD